MKKIIEVKALSKTFGHVKAVNDINFYVEEGSLFSFLGTNGAGKSTTISILLTLLKQDAGKVTVNGYTVGKDDYAIRKEIGVVFEQKRKRLGQPRQALEDLKIKALFAFNFKFEATRGARRWSLDAECQS